MTCLNEKDLKKNSDKHFEDIEIVNFDLIHHRYRDNPLKNFVKIIKLLEKKDCKGYSQKDQSKALSSAFRNKRDGLYIKRKLMIEYFKNLKF